jgi:histidinol phosphatase-like enzyme (inositol monophosphatase family)
LHNKDYSEYLDFAHRLADASGEIVRRYYHEQVTISEKADKSPVTEADIAVEKAIRDMIAAAYPEHGIIGEELGKCNSDSAFQWVIDPIDGTKSFIARELVFTTLIALCYEGKPVVGVINQPILNERWAAVTGETKEHFNHSKSLSEAELSTTSSDYFTPKQAVLFSKLAEQVGSIILGGDAYAYGLLASGKRDLVVDAGMKVHDFCALVPVVEAAGGIITDWQGNPLTLSSDGTVLAAINKNLYAEALTILNK